MAGAQGTATLSFPVDAQPAQYVTSTVVTDSVPNPSAVWMAQAILSNSYSCFAYGNGIFVAIASTGGTTITSTDGVNWTQRSMPTANQWSTLTFGGGLFVAIVVSTTIAATSPDGINWTLQTLPVSAAWFSSTYGNGTFLAVGYNSSIAVTSPDGVSWTQQALPTTAQWNGSTYGNGVFVITATGPGTTAATSPTGVTWTAQTMPVAANWYSVSYGNGVFLAVASNFISATSVNGSSWVQRTLPVDAAFPTSVFANGKFLISYNSAVLVSTDGIAWAFSFLPAIQAWGPIAFGNGLYIASSYNSAIFARTSDPTPTNVRTITTVNTQIVPAYPVVGSNIASVTVTGQTGLLTTSTVDAWMQANDSTASHNAYEHGIAPIKLTTGELIAGTGFTITGVSDQRIDGDFIVHWIWRD